MKRFLTRTNIDDSKKSRSVSTAIDLAEVGIDDPGQFDDARAPPTEADGFERINHSSINLSNHYLFDGKFYDIVSNIGTKLIAKCVLFQKTLQGQYNSSGNFLSHLKVSS